MKFIAPKALTLICVAMAVVVARHLDTVVENNVVGRKALMIPNKQKTRVQHKLHAHPIKDYLEKQRKNQSVKKGVRRFKVNVKLPNPNFTKFMKISSRKNLAASRSKSPVKNIPVIAQKPSLATKSHNIQRSLKVQPPKVEVDSQERSIVENKSSDLDQVFDELKSLDLSLSQIKESDANTITKQTQDKLIEVLNKYKEVLQQNPIDEKSFLADKIPAPPRQLINLESASKSSKPLIATEEHAEPKKLEMKAPIQAQKLKMKAPIQVKKLEMKAPIQAKKRSVEPLVSAPKTKLASETKTFAKLSEKKLSEPKFESKVSVKTMEETIDRMKSKLEKIAESKKEQVVALQSKKEKARIVKEITQAKLKKDIKSKKTVARKAKIVSKKQKKKVKKAKTNRKLGKTVHKIDRTSTTLVTVKISKPPKNTSFLNPENNKADFYRFKNKSFKLSAQISNLRFMVQKLSTCYERVHEIQLANHNFSLFSVECRDELIIVMRAIVELKKWGKSIIYRYILSNVNVRTLSILDHELRLPRPLSVSKLSVPFSLFYNNLQSHYSRFKLSAYTHRYEHQCQSLVEFYDHTFSKTLPIIEEMVKSLEYTHAMSALIEFNHEVQIFKQVNTLIEEHKRGIVHESIPAPASENNELPASNTKPSEQLLDLAAKIQQDQVSDFTEVQPSNSGEPNLIDNDDNAVIYSPPDLTENNSEPVENEKDGQIDDDKEESYSIDSVDAETQGAQENSTDCVDAQSDGEQDAPLISSLVVPDFKDKQPLVINLSQLNDVAQPEAQPAEPIAVQDNELSDLKSLIQGLEKQMREITAQLPLQKEKTLDGEIRENEQKLQKSLDDPASLKVENPYAEKEGEKPETEENKQVIVINSPPSIDNKEDIDKIEIVQHNPNGQEQKLTPIIFSAEDLKANIQNIPIHKIEDQKPQAPNYNGMTPDEKIRIFANLIKQIPTNNSQNFNRPTNLPSKIPDNENQDEEDDEDDEDDQEDLGSMPQFGGPSPVPKFPLAFPPQQVTRPISLPINISRPFDNPLIDNRPQIVNKNDVPKKNNLLFSSGPIYHPQLIDKGEEQPLKPTKVLTLPKVEPVSALILPPNGYNPSQNQPWNANLPRKWIFDDEVKPANINLMKPTSVPVNARFAGKPDAKTLYKPISESATQNLANKENINNHLNNINAFRNIDFKNNFANPLNKPLLKAESKPIQPQQAAQAREESINGVLNLEVPLNGSKTGTFKNGGSQIDLTVNHIVDDANKPKTEFIYDKEERMRQLAKLRLSDIELLGKTAPPKAKALSEAKTPKKAQENNYMNSFSKIKIIEEKEDKHPQTKKLLQNSKPDRNKISAQIAKTAQNQRPKGTSSILASTQMIKSISQRSLQKNENPIVKKEDKHSVNKNASKASAKKLAVKPSPKKQHLASVSSKKVQNQFAAHRSLNKKKLETNHKAQIQKSEQKRSRKSTSRLVGEAQNTAQLSKTQSSVKTQQPTDRQLRDIFRRHIRL